MNKLIYIMMAALPLFMVSCGGSQSQTQQANETKSQNPLVLEGKWKIISAMDKNADGAMNEAFILFDANHSVSGCTGVNNFSGSYEKDAHQLMFSQIGSTKMMGDPDSDAIEQAVLAALNKVVAIKEVSENQMELMNGDMEVVMKLEKM